MSPVTSPKARGHRVSEGTVYNAQSALSDRLATYDQRMPARLAQEPVLHFNETGIRVEGRFHGLHSASTPALTYYHVDRHRGGDFDPRHQVEDLAFDCRPEERSASSGSPQCLQATGR